MEFSSQENRWRSHGALNRTLLAQPQIEISSHTLASSPATAVRLSCSATANWPYLSLSVPRHSRPGKVPVTRERHMLQAQPPIKVTPRLRLRLYGSYLSLNTSRLPASTFHTLYHSKPIPNQYQTINQRVHTLPNYKYITEVNTEPTTTSQWVSSGPRGSVVVALVLISPLIAMV